MTQKDVVLSYYPIVSTTKVAPIKTEHSCGFILEYHGRHFVLTTSHGILKESRTAVVIAPFPIVPNAIIFNPTFVTTFQVTIVARILKFLNIFMRNKIKVKNENLLFRIKEDMDIALCEIPIPIVGVHNVYGSPYFGQQKTTVPTPGSMKLSSGELCTFAGLTFKTTEGGVLVFDEVYVDSLKFKKKRGMFNLFSLKGKERLAGCSGTPIFNSTGELVSLLVMKKGKTVYGLSLDKILELLVQIEGGMIK